MHFKYLNLIRFKSQRIKEYNQKLLFTNVNEVLVLLGLTGIFFFLNLVFNQIQLKI